MYNTRFLVKMVSMMLCCFITVTSLAQQEQKVQKHKYIAENKLPRAVIETMLKEYPGFRLASIEKCKRDKPKNTIYYIIYVEKSDTQYQATVAEDGTMINKGWLTFYPRNVKVTK